MRKAPSRQMVIYFGALTILSFIAFVFYGLPLLRKGAAAPPKPIIKAGDCSQAEYYVSDVLHHAKCSFSDPDSNDLWIVVDAKVYDVSSWSTCSNFLCVFFTESRWWSL